MTISINQISGGMGLRVNNDIFLISEFQHVKPGKGSAFVRVKLKNLKTDAVIDRTFKTSDKLEDVALEERKMQYLYQDTAYHFMDLATFEQIAFPRGELGDIAKFLLENLEVSGIFEGNTLLKVLLPTFITTKITETEPGIKGDSSRAGTKPASIETGTTIQVPLFVNMGDFVKIDTRTGEYVERVQK